MSPRVVSAAQWLAARKELQAAEEEAIRTLQEIAGRRREMPADPAWDEGCPVCSYQADSVGDLAHLHARNTTFAAVSRAPISKIEPFRQRMGWTFPWYSSHGSDFNYDFHVTNDESVTPIEYNFRTAQELADRGRPWAARPGEQGGVSVFLRDGDTVLRTWSGYGPVIELFCETDILLDMTPLGRQDETVELLHHDKYA